MANNQALSHVSTGPGNRTSILDLPNELRLRIYQMAMPNVSSSALTNYVNTTAFKPPFFSPSPLAERGTAKALMLVHSQVRDDMNEWLYGLRRVRLSSLNNAQNLHMKIGAEIFGKLRRISISFGWGDSNNLNSSYKLECLLQHLPNINSMSLLLFGKGLRGPNNNYIHHNWTTTQLRFMLTILQANERLVKVFFQEDNADYARSARFCSVNMRRKPEEREVILPALRARRHRLVALK